jgi:flagellar secretion chaperone FliS
MTQSAMAHRANQAYRGAAVTVPPLRAVIMLLNSAISSLQKSLLAQEAKHFEEGFQQLTRATAILRGLSYHLDFERSGALAEQLFKTYNSLIMACLRSYGKPQADQHYRRIIASLSELREAWEFVDGTMTAKGTAKVAVK